MSQTFIISTVFPGIFNLLLIVFSVKPTLIISDWTLYTPTMWILLLFSSFILTIALGMLMEKPIYTTIKCLSERCDFEKYEDLDAWRIYLIKKACSNVDKFECKIQPLYSKIRTGQFEHKMNYMEQLMSEYYCLNNIIPAILLSIILQIFFPKCKCEPPLHYLVLVEVLSLLLIGKCMYEWLNEFHELRKIL